MKENNNNVLTQAQAVRLECIRIVHRPDKDSEILIGKADALATYVLQGNADKPRARHDSLQVVSPTRPTA